MREHLSNSLLDLAAAAAFALAVWTFLIGPRLKGRRACNYVIRQAARQLPGAILSNQGPWWWRKLKLTWQTELGVGKTARPAQLTAALSLFPPWEIRLILTQPGEDKGYIASYQWRQWPHSLSPLDVECTSRRQMLAYLHNQVRLVLNFRVRREYHRPLDLARAALQGFPGVDLAGIID